MSQSSNTRRSSDAGVRQERAHHEQHLKTGSCPSTPDTPAPSPPNGRDEPWKAKARERDLYKAILAYVDAYDPVTFAELTRRLHPYCRVDGDRAVVIGGVPHVVLWPGVNQRFVDAVNRLLNDARIHITAANETIYAMQGVTVNLPISGGSSVLRPVDQWCPVFLRAGNEASARPLSNDEIMASAMRA